MIHKVHTLAVPIGQWNGDNLCQHFLLFMDYGKWKMEILKISRYRISVKVETVQALIEKGSLLKREGKIRNYDEWTHFMWVLKNKYREMTCE